MAEMRLSDLGLPDAPKKESSLLAMLGQTWPARAAQDIWSAVQAPGNAWKSTWDNPITTEQMVKPAADLAGIVIGSPGTPSGALGSSMRRLPTDNYLKPMKEYTSALYRETSPESALEVMPFSNVYAGSGPGGPQRLFYSDVPELALGQGNNKGVRMKYDADAFHGQINQKPGWQVPFQSGAAEYTAAIRNGFSARDAVQAVEIDMSKIRNQSPVVRAQIVRAMKSMENAGWSKSEADGLVTFTKP